ncbi:MAG TPA: CBS domain-containing protein [Chloroflexota bacterium]|nr:CBS domain-containing protein [Chloroflexota bacterium]
MNVGDIMSKDVVTVQADESVAQVVRTLLDAGLSGVPVLDEGGAMVGMVTQHDVVTKHAHPHVPLYLGILGTAVPLFGSDSEEELRRVLAVSARDLMSHVPAVSRTMDVTDLADLMVNKSVNPVPVVDDGELVGVVSYSDVLRLVLTEESDGGD